MAIHHQLQSLLLNVDRLLHHLGFGIEFAQAEVIGGQLRGQHQVHVVHVGCGRLQVGIRGLHAAPHLAEEVGLVIDEERDLVGALGQRPANGYDFRTIARIAIAGGVGIDIGLGKESRRGHPRQRARFLQPILRRQQRLIGLEQLLLVGVQLGIVEDFPPCALGKRVFGSRLAPRGFGLVGVSGSLRRRTIVVRAHHASSQQSHAARSAAARVRPLHDFWPP